MIAKSCIHKNSVAPFILLAGFLTLAPCLAAQQGPWEKPITVGKIEIQHVQGNVYMFSGAGSNVTVQVGSEAVYVVNTGMPSMTDQVITAIKQLSNRPIVYIIDTSADLSDAGGNAILAQAGTYDTGQPGERPGAGIGAYVSVLDKLTAQKKPFEELPTDTYSVHSWALFNDEPIILIHPANAHTDGDSYVFFRRSDVISTGDIFTPSLYPVIRSDQGGSIDGLLDALNDIISIMVPKVNEEAGTYLIPGHGRICDRTDVVNYRDALTVIRARIQDLVSKGMTLDQVKATTPTADYDGMYGADSGDWTTGMFIEAVYNDALKSKKDSQKPSAPAKQKSPANSGGKQS